MTTTPTRPEVVKLSPYRAIPKRWHPDHGWYWQVVYQGRGGETAWTGYATPKQMPGIVAKLVLLDQNATDAQPEPGGIETLTDLLETWAGDYLQPALERREVTKATFDTYCQSAGRVKRAAGDVVLSALDGDFLDRYDAKRLADGYAPATVKLERVVIGEAWMWAQDRGHAPSRRLPKTKLDPEPVSETYVPTRSEIAATFACMTEDWRREALRLQYATGARVREIATLRVGDVDLDGLVVKIMVSKTERRHVPISAEVAEIASAWLRSSGRGKLGRDAPLFADDVPEKPAKTCNAAIAAAAVRAGVPHWTTHGLRYRAVMDMLEAGADQKEISEITGHSVDTMMKVYRKVSTAGKRRVVEVAQLGVLPEAPAGLKPPAPRPRRPSISRRRAE